MDIIHTRILLEELANSILIIFQFPNNVDCGANPVMKTIPEKQVPGLQYITGHVLHQFYKKFCTKMMQCDDTQEFLSILEAGK